MSRNGFLGFLLLALCFFVTPASAAFIGSWDLRGAGQLDSVYREGNVLRVIEAGGRRVDYRFIRLIGHWCRLQTQMVLRAWKW